jgi:hypothetical protein
VVERTNSSSQNAHKELLWCTERQGRVIDFWVAFSNAIIIVGRFVRKAWVRYRVGRDVPIAAHDLLARPIKEIYRKLDVEVLARKSGELIITVASGKRVLVPGDPGLS